MANEENVVTIDGKKYNWADLNKEARAALANISAVDAELKRLRVQVGIAQAARASFAEQLKANLPATGKKS